MKKHKYNVGDKVIVRPDLNHEVSVVSNYSSRDLGIHPNMVSRAGQIVTIVKTVKIIGTGDSIVGDAYKIKEDEGQFYWTDNILLSYVNETADDFSAENLFSFIEEN